jgi:monoamine oxidase
VCYGIGGGGGGGSSSGGGGGSVVTVRAADGRTATATCGVIVAVPLGVLQQQQPMVFSPPLEQSRLNAMQRIGMAAMCKLTLTFAQRWWPADVEVVTLLDEPAMLAISLDDVLGDGRGAAAAAAVHALQFFATGQEARAWEEMDADAVVARMATRYPALAAADRPLSAHLTRWSSAEPFTRGAYSFSKVGGSRKCFAVLARPLEGTCGRVQFAGEHTSAKYNATMHGAILSGRDAAQRLLRLV